MANTCYICGKEMVEGTDNCPHYEHIIPNALGGHLTSNTILCKKCGGDYSKGDRSFVDIFGGFIHNIENRMLFDRKHDGARVAGHYYLDKNKIDIVVDKDAVAPRNPIVEEDSCKVKIVANNKVAKQLSKKYEKQGKTVETVENLYGSVLLHFSEGNENFNSELKEGLVKIAVEYALNCRVGRDQLEEALTINDDNSAIVNFGDIAVFPFVQMDVFNGVFETHRHELEKNYPSHALLLFNDNKRLWCYVDLFSTFQYYVLLSENYNGTDILQSYYQPLFTQKIQNKYSKEELTRMGMSDLLMVLNELGIKYKDKTIEQLVDEAVDISNKQDIKRSYDDIRRLIPDLALVKSFLVGDVCSDNCDYEIEQNVLDEMKANCIPEGYRRFLWKKCNGKMERFSYPDMCNRLAAEAPEEVKNYTCMKYRQFEAYSNAVHFEEQIKKIWK